MDEKRDFTYKEMDAGNKELFSMLIYRPAANFLLNIFFKRIDITPNQISLLSLLAVAIGSLFFAFLRFPFTIAGVLFLHLCYTLDMLDGQYARYKGLSSKLGKWFDPFLDVIKVVFIFSSLSYAAYISGSSYTVFLWGIGALSNSFLTFYIMNTRNLIIKEHKFQVKIKKNIYVGYEISLYWAISLIVAFNRLHWGLIFLATVGALSWIKIYATLRRYYHEHKEQIEGGV